MPSIPSSRSHRNAKPLEVEVVSLDWKWLFIYPDEGVAAVNQLVVPVGTPVHFRLTSNGVMNSFFVPQLGSQIYTMAGMTSQLNLQADEAGTYPGLSAQFSGDGFSGMHFEVRALPADGLRAMGRRTPRRAPIASTRRAYAELAKPSEDADAQDLWRGRRRNCSARSSIKPRRRPRAPRPCRRPGCAARQPAEGS